MYLHYDWIHEEPSARRDVDDRTIYYNDKLKRALRLRKEIIGVNRQYHVSYSAQIVSGRHERSVDTRTFTSLNTATELLFELAQKYAPQIIIDKIKEDMKGI